MLEERMCSIGGFGGQKCGRPVMMEGRQIIFINVMMHTSGKTIMCDRWKFTGTKEEEKAVEQHTANPSDLSEAQVGNVGLLTLSALQAGSHISRRQHDLKVSRSWIFLVWWSLARSPVWLTDSTCLTLKSANHNHINPTRGHVP
jgi:hypothetical protein